MAGSTLGFVKFKRLPGALGHALIWVTCVDGDPTHPAGPRKGMVQCYTIDRISFMMKHTHWERDYELA